VVTVQVQIGPSPRQVWRILSSTAAIAVYVVIAAVFFGVMWAVTIAMWLP
jgi:hypothetical protein